MHVSRPWAHCDGAPCRAAHVASVAVVAARGRRVPQGATPACSERVCAERGARRAKGGVTARGPRGQRADCTHARWGTRRRDGRAALSAVCARPCVVASRSLSQGSDCGRTRVRHNCKAPAARASASALLAWRPRVRAQRVRRARLSDARRAISRADNMVPPRATLHSPAARLALLLLAAAAVAAPGLAAASAGSSTGAGGAAAVSDVYFYSQNPGLVHFDVVLHDGSNGLGDGTWDHFLDTDILDTKISFWI